VDDIVVLIENHIGPQTPQTMLEGEQVLSQG
jgi:hypothetical protein